MMSAIVSVFAYGIQIIGIAVVACVLSFIPAFIVRQRNKKAVWSVFLIAVVIVVLSMGILSKKPIWNCPEEYADYIPENKKQELIALNAGLYSFAIPVTAVCISVTAADENEIAVTTQYLFFGRKDMVLGRDGPYTTKSLY